MRAGRHAVRAAGVGALALVLATGAVLAAAAAPIPLAPAAPGAGPATGGAAGAATTTVSGAAGQATRTGPAATLAGATDPGTGPGPAASRAVALPTGERVAVTPTGGGPVLALGTPPPGGGPRRVRAMAFGGHDYVVPDAALPELGRSLPLSAFDVAPAPASPPANPAFPMATLTVRGTDLAGAPAISGSVAVDNVDDLQRYANMQSFGATGSVSFSVPVGHYSIAAEIATLGADGSIGTESLIFLPEVQIDAPATTVDVAAASATTRVPVPTTPRASVFEQVSAVYGRSSANGMEASISYILAGGSPALYVTPTSPVSIGTVHWYTYFRLTSPAGQAEPYLYDVQFPVTATVPAEFPSKVDAGSLAAVSAQYHSDVANHRIGTYRPSVQPWEFAPIRFASAAVAPLRRTEYVSALPEVRWISGVLWKPDESNGVDLGPWAQLDPGQRLTEQPLAAPLAPGADAERVASVPCTACRQGDTLGLSVATWARGDRIVGGLTPTPTLAVTTAARLVADGTEVAAPAAASGTFAIPADSRTLRLELEATKSGAWTTTSTRISTAWAWPTRPGTGQLPPQRLCPDGTGACGFEPLLFLDYDAGVSQSNGVPAGTRFDVAVRVRHQPFDPAPAADRLTFDVSGDDGATWAPATVVAAGGGGFTVGVVPPAGSRFLAFRVHAGDPAGSSIDQTVIRAVQVTG